MSPKTITKVTGVQLGVTTDELGDEIQAGVTPTTPTTPTTSSAEPQAEKKLLPPPNGGWMAWLQVSAAFVLYWNTL